MSFLINTEAAQSFMQLAMTETGCKAFLGDAEQFDSAVGPDITASNIALRQAVEKVFALGDDPTRNEVQKHEAAQYLAGQTIAQIEKAKAAIDRRAETLYHDGLTKAEILFAPEQNRGQIDSEIRAYIREEAKKTNGVARVRQLMTEDRNVAAAVYHSPQFLLGIEDSLHTRLRFEAIERHYPETYKSMTDSVALRDLAPRYERTIRSIRTSFANGSIAAQASRRVSL